MLEEIRTIHQTLQRLPDPSRLGLSPLQASHIRSRLLEVAEILSKRLDDAGAIRV